MAPVNRHYRATTSLDLIRRAPGHDPVVVVAKRHQDRTQFEHEVRWLTAARHLSVPQLETIVADRLTMSTRFIPARTLADTAASPGLARATLSRLALLVAQLSVDDLVHGNLDVDHVLRDRQGEVFVVSPAPTGPGDDDLIGLARCCRQVMEVADAIALERGGHPWTDRQRQAWHELTATLTSGGLGPRRAARFIELHGPPTDRSADGRLRQWLRS